VEEKEASTATNALAYFISTIVGAEKNFIVYATDGKYRYGFWNLISNEMSNIENF
jgi:hypothetical protein